MSLPVTFSGGNLPPGYCFSSLQQLFNDFVSLLTGTVATGTSLNVMQQPTPPGAQYQGNTLWIKTDTLGNPIRQFTYANGYWLSPHAIPPGSQTRQIWVGQESDLWNYDGGDGTDPNPEDSGYVAPTLYTGAMWRIDPKFTFKFPLGVGYGNTTNSTSNPNAYTTTFDGRTVSILSTGATSGLTAGDDGSTAGSERIVLTNKEIWHQHAVGKLNMVISGQRDYLTLEDGGGTGAGTLTANAPYTTSNDIQTGTQSPVSGADITSVTGGRTFETDAPYQADQIKNPDNNSYNGFKPSSSLNMPPFIVVGFIMRTSRAYYTGS